MSKTNQVSSKDIRTPSDTELSDTELQTVVGGNIWKVVADAVDHFVVFGASSTQPGFDIKANKKM